MGKQDGRRKSRLIEGGADLSLACQIHDLANERPASALCLARGPRRRRRRVDKLINRGLSLCACLKRARARAQTQMDYGSPCARLVGQFLHAGELGNDDEIKQD